MRGFYNFMRGAFGWIVKLIYPVKIIGDKKSIPKKGKVVMISNHLSYKDIPVLVAYFPGYRHFLAKKELSKNAIARWFFTKMGVFFVDREKLDLNAIKTGIKYLKNDEGLALFPEGTRNKTGGTDLQQIKGGAAMFAVKGQAPIVPVHIQSKIRAFRRTYIYVGNAIDLSEYFDTRFGSEQLAIASDKISDQMEADKQFIDDYVLNKRWKKKNLLEAPKK